MNKENPALLKARIEQLERQLNEKTKELKDSKLKGAALETMIRLAERKWNIQVKKNSGTKQ